MKSPVPSFVFGPMVTAFALLSPASVAQAAGATATATVTIVRPLSLVNTNDLDFGILSAGSTGGTATIDPATGVRTVTGGVTAKGGSPRRAEFVGAGQVGLLSFVAISASPTLNNGSGGTMTTSLAVEGGVGLRLLPGTGVQTFRVGGTLNVGAAQAEGDYSGAFTLTITYF